MKDESGTSPRELTMLAFGVEQEREYLDWLAANPRGFVLNLNTGGPVDDVVHASRCPTLAVERYDKHTSFT
jgi:hypothetical protein